MPYVYSSLALIYRKLEEYVIRKQAWLNNGEKSLEYIILARKFNQEASFSFVVMVGWLEQIPLRTKYICT